MSTGNKRSALSYIPGLASNAVLQLIIGLALTYTMLALCWAVMLLVYGDQANFSIYFLPAVSLPHISGFASHWWTLFTYGIFHYPDGFMEMASNMLWLYCFGSVVQMLVGHKQIIPLYLFGAVAGGAVYMLAQLLPGAWGNSPLHLLGPRAGLMAMAAAAITLTPKYRFFITPTFSIPLAVVAGVFAVLMVFGSGFYLPVALLLAGGGLMGFAYVRLLRAGYKPGEWMYTGMAKIEGLVTPADDAAWKKHNKRRTEYLDRVYEPRDGVSQKRIDDILDKINQKGYKALTADEREALMRVGKE